MKWSKIHVAVAFLLFASILLSGCVSSGTDNTVHTVPDESVMPSQPTSLEVSYEYVEKDGKHGYTFTLDWKYDASNTDGFIVYRDDKKIDTFTVENPNFVDDDILPFGTYSYYVVAYNEYGISSPSDVAVINVSASETPSDSVPKDPTNLWASICSGGIEDGKSILSVELGWNDCSDNEDGFLIFRNGELIMVVPENTTEQVDENFFVDSHVFGYQVIAYNVNGISNPTNIAEVYWGLSHMG